METAAAAKHQLQIGRYTVEAKLAEGGMAYTWLCRLHGAQGFSKAFVVKTLKPTCRSQPFLTMFVDEARLGARIDHPNVCRIVELGDSNGMPFLVQEFVDGPTLKQITTRQAARRGFDVPFGVQIIAEIARALYAVHNITDEDGRRLNVVHRDVSPSNVLVSRQGIPKLIDFGVARFDDRETQTEVGVLKGKLRYMAPEIVRGGPPSHQSDIYSLGICLVSVCGATSLGRDGGMFHLSDLDHVPMDADLKRIVADCLRPHPADRWADGSALADALERWLERHGGRLNAQALAERVGELFPSGPSEWRSEELTVALVRSELSSGLMIRNPPSRRRLWVPALAAILAAGMLLLVVAVTAVGIAVTAARNPAAPDPEAAAFARAEDAVRHGRVDEAAEALVALADMPLDPDERQRLDELDGQLFDARVARIRTLAAVDPVAALASARSLAEERPDHPELLDLIARLVAETRPPAPVPAPPTPAGPSPVPTPKPPVPTDPGDDLFGERMGRPPSAP